MIYYAKSGVAVIESGFRKIKWALAALASLIVIASFFTAGLFVALHADHDCVGDGCGVCAQIHVISETLKRFSGCAAFAVLALPAYVFAFMPQGMSCVIFAHIGHSPVQAKVRLNN
ncbi:MAG: hypothetical protein LBG29_00665 [Synergistaceae bacterium]|jgi:hypothetical protein|nr:hypothetical protein [Synergistaceae bacterium]